MREDRLSAWAGESMITTTTFASLDEDESAAEGTLVRINIILKACPAPYTTILWIFMVLM